MGEIGRFSNHLQYDTRSIHSESLRKKRRNKPPPLEVDVYTFPCIYIYDCSLVMHS